MNAMSILVWLVVGLIAGWLAGEVTRGTGFGLVGNIIVGIVGAVLGGILLSALGVSVSGGILIQILVAFLGALILLAIVNLVRRATYRRCRVVFFLESSAGLYSPDLIVY